MSLKEYFDTAKGLGVLSTADSDGQVDAAIYSRPHFMEDGTMAFVMRDRLSHHNLQSNPHATYLFKEEGVRLQRKKTFYVQVKRRTEYRIAGIPATQKGRIREWCGQVSCFF